MEPWSVPLHQCYEATRSSQCVKSVRIRSYSGSHFPVFELNTERPEKLNADQKNTKYGHFLDTKSYTGRSSASKLKV